MALDIENDMGKHRGQASKPKQSSSHCQADIRHCDRITQGSSQKKPPNSCQICLKLKGEQHMHWHSECPNRNKNFKPKAATKPQQTQDNDANNAVNDDSTGVSPKDNFATVSASIGKTELLATVDSASTVNLMPFIFAKSLRLHIDFEDVKSIRMAKGKVQTSGTVQFNLTINSVTKRIKVLVLKDFTYCLLLGVPTCRAFDLTVHFGTLTVIGPPQAAQAVHTQQLTHNCSQTSRSKDNTTHLTLIESAVKTGSLIHTPQTSESQPSRSPTQTTQSVNQLLKKYQTLFADGPTDLGRITIESHRILLSDNIPCAQRPYHQSSKDAEETSRQVNELLAKGLIRESTSPWAAPVTLADKADGTRRLCIDYRRVNQKTIPDKQPMPYIADLLEKFQGSRFSTKLDMASGYWQVAMHPEDIHKTAFVTADGHFEWLVLPFGLKNAPATFQRIVRKVLGDLLNHGVLSYLDDIVIYAKTKQKHDALLKQVFERLDNHNVKLKREKCQFSQPQVEFVGHIICNDEVRPIPGKVKAVLDFPDPTNQKEVQQFHGLASYFREYMPNFSSIAEPITRLTRKKELFVWGPEQQAAIAQIKHMLANEPTRRLFDPDSPVELHTDASSIGIGSILIQNGQPVDYFSRKLSDAERRLAATELECLAVVDSIDHFRTYLECRPFKLVTDHSALQWLSRVKDSKSKLFRWDQKLKLYTYTVEHRPGRQMAHVDALSRAPVTLVLSSDAIREAQQVSIDPPTHTVTTNPDGLKQVKIRCRNRILIPDTLKFQILIEGHDKAGHPGIRKSLAQLGRIYWWPTMTHDIKQYVRSCHTCQMVKPANHPYFGQLQPLPTPAMPMELISMDTVVMGSSASKTQAKYIQIVLDHCSRYVWGRATSKNSAQTIVTILDEIFRTVKPAKRLLTDNYKSFRSKELQRFLNKHKCSRSFTSTYHPQTNGANEKINDTIVKGIRLALKDSPRKEWTTVLKDVVQNYNNIIHENTGFTPSYLMFGTDNLNTRTPPLAEALQSAMFRTEAFKLRKKQAYDQTHHPLNLNVGDLVKRRIPSNRPDVKKLTPKYEGPYDVTELRGPVDVMVTDRKPDSTPFLVHVSQLEPYFLRDGSFSNAGE